MVFQYGYIYFLMKKFKEQISDKTFSISFLMKAIAAVINLYPGICPSKGNLFGQSTLLMNATYIVSP